MTSIRKHRFIAIYLIVLIAFTAYIIADTFLIERSYQEVAATSPETSSDDSTATGQSASTAQDSAEPEIELTETRYEGSTVYVADITISSSSEIRTAFAQNIYGRNVTATTSEIAKNVGATLAINGDFYGAQQSGYVIRNGVLYRDTAESGREDFVIFNDGTVEIINESEVTADELIEKGAVQLLSFGPCLIDNGTITVGEDDEVGKSMAGNPRTAIGVIDENHWIFVVSDGRTDESPGLSLSQLAEFMESLGVKTAYNLDGGGSSTMYYNGEIVNNPTTNGNKIKERSISDIVYIK